MSYRSETIALAIGRMNRQYFLPAIQREFVWKPEQIVQLFDSIMRGYPISSFLFWELKPENRDKWQVYEFLEKAQYGGTHNQLASTYGVPSLSLVLDGQQRLTSLMIGLRGTYTAKKKYKRWDNPDAWSAQRLHLDLFADPRLDSEGSSESGVYYKFEFMEETPVPNSEHYWFKIGRILDFDERQKFEAFLDEKDDELSKQGCRAASVRRSNEILIGFIRLCTSMRSSPTTRRLIKITIAFWTSSFVRTRAELN